MPARTCLTINDLAGMAARYGAPVEDVLLIAVNLYGISSAQGRHRARVKVRLVSAPDVTWTVIVPLNARGSPFTLVDQDLYFGEDLVARVTRIAAEGAFGGYFRDGGGAATLNPNARSR